MTEQHAYRCGYLERMKEQGDTVTDIVFSELSGRTRDHIDQKYEDWGKLEHELPADV